MIDSFRGEYFFLSNFYPHAIELNGLKYPCNENAFQALKIVNKDDRKIFETISPKEAKKLGRHVQLRANWNDMRYDIMYQLCVLKYSDPVLKAKLIATYPEQLIEGNVWGDKYWGAVNGIGQNKLGKILMKIRDDLLI